MEKYIIDFETTGVDPEICRPIEVALLQIKDSQCTPTSFLILDPSYPPLAKEISDLTGITAEVLLTEGTRSPNEAMYWLVSKLSGNIAIAHNANAFDRVVFEAECKRQGIPYAGVIWVDTMIDVPWKCKTKCRVLSHLALEHKIKFDPEILHRASGDVWLLNELLKQYDFSEILRRATSPKVILLANVSFDEKELAKDAGFRWQKIGTRMFPKRWVLEILECDSEGFRTRLPFNTEVVSCIEK